MNLSIIVHIRPGLIQIPRPSQPSLKAKAERCIDQLLNQTIQEGVEVIAVVDGGVPMDEMDADHSSSKWSEVVETLSELIPYIQSGVDIADHLESVFGTERASGRFRVHRLPLSGDSAKLKNEGAAIAKGRFLAFTDATETWKITRLKKIHPYLEKNLLLISTQMPVGNHSDWLFSLIAGNWTNRSSLFVNRTLFDSTKGFPEGYSGYISPRRIPGQENYEFCIQCLIELMRIEGTKLPKKFFLLEEYHVEQEDEFPLPHPVLEKVRSILNIGTQGFRERISLIHLSRKLPSRYWPIIARRLVGRNLKKIPHGETISYPKRKRLFPRKH